MWKRVLVALLVMVSFMTTGLGARPARADFIDDLKQQLQDCGDLTESKVGQNPSLCLTCQGLAATIPTTNVELTKLKLKTQGVTALYCGAEALKKAVELYKTTKAAAGVAQEAVSCALADKGPHDCCLSTVKEPNPEGKGGIVKEKCAIGEYTYADCYCTKEGQTQFQQKTLEFSQCQDTCKGQGGTMDKSQGVGLLGPDSPIAAAAEKLGKEQEQFVNALCFTPNECAKLGGTFAGTTKECQLGSGKCIAPEPVIRLSSPILNQVTVTGIRGYIELALRFSLNAALLAAVIMFVYGGFMYIVAASGIPIKSAKETMVNALVGFFLAVGAVTILNAINPATTSYTKPVIYLVNRLLFTRANWCSDFQPKPPADAKGYAFSGEPATSIKFNDAKFDLDLDKTECGKKYYPFGYTGKTCSGRICPEKGKACISCKGGFKECGNNKESYGCISAAIAGNISWVGFHYPMHVELLAVCNSAAPTQTFDQLKGSVDEGIEAEIPDTTDVEHGVTGFLIPSDVAQLADAKANCKDGVKGFILGIKYKDSCTKLKALIGQTGKGGAVTAVTGAVGTAVGGVGGAIGGAAVGGVAGTVVPGLGNVVGLVVGGGVGGTAGVIGGNAVGKQVGKLIECLAAANDIAIVTKRDCNRGGTNYYSGYADGTNVPGDLTDMVAAMYCGYHRKPGDNSNYQLGQNTGTFDIQDGENNPYWTVQELSDVIEGKRQAFECDLALNDENAASNPGSAYMFGCVDPSGTP